MSALENWVLKLADNDSTWIGFGWLRPKKDEIVGPGFVLLCSIVTGLPGLAAGAGLIYLWLGSVSPTVCWMMFACVMLFEVPAHLVFAYAWNRRARSLLA